MWGSLSIYIYIFYTLNKYINHLSYKYIYKHSIDGEIFYKVFWRLLIIDLIVYIYVNSRSSWFSFGYGYDNFSI